MAWQVTRGVPENPAAQVPTQVLPTVLFLGQLKLPLGGLAGLTEQITATATETKWAEALTEAQAECSGSSFMQHQKLDQQPTTV